MLAFYFVLIGIGLMALYGAAAEWQNRRWADGGFRETDAETFKNVKVIENADSAFDTLPRSEFSMDFVIEAEVDPAGREGFAAYSLSGGQFLAWSWDKERCEADAKKVLADLWN